jgi:hypothetical protein
MESAIWLIRIGTGATMLTFGVNQILKPLPWIDEYAPEFIKMGKIVDSKLFMRTHGFINILLGLFLMTRILPDINAFLVLLWWLSILPFAFMGSWKAGMRDLAIVTGLIALVRLESLL